MALHKVFVYGTLKKGQPNHWRMEVTKHRIAKFLGEAKLAKKYPLVVAGQYNIPFLLPLEGRGKEVYGELYEVDSEMLGHLDELEDHPKWYTRTPAQCMLGSQGQDGGDFSGSPVDCETYFLFDYKDELLKLPAISNYDSNAVDQKPFVYKEKRGLSSHAMDQVKKK